MILFITLYHNSTPQGKLQDYSCFVDLLSSTTSSAEVSFRVFMLTGNFSKVVFNQVIVQYVVIEGLRLENVQRVDLFSKGVGILTP